MQPRAENGDGATIPIKGRVGDKLVIQGGVDGFPDFEIVIGFQSSFPAIIQIAIARLNPCAASLKKFLRGVRDAVQHPPDQRCPQADARIPL